jgi:hypothetical protein
VHWFRGTHQHHLYSSIGASVALVVVHGRKALSHDLARIPRLIVRLVVPGLESSVEEIGAFGRIYTIAAPRAPLLDRRYHMLLPHTYTWPGSTPLRRILAEERPHLVEVCDKFWLAYLPLLPRTADGGGPFHKAAGSLQAP